MVKVYMYGDSVDYTFEDLLNIMAILRGENGCPWDIEQNHKSIRNNLLEEAYELADAIDRLDKTDMVEELGDLLLQIVFHCQIAKENNLFDINSVADGICKKLIYRHPHIFSNVKADTSEEVLANWDKLKTKEKHMSTYTETLKAVPNTFPACLKAQKVQKRASKAGYDFANVNDAIKKLDEEILELKDSLETTDKENMFSELGDVLFSAVNIARLIGADAEEELSLATNRFVTRFAHAEKIAIDKGQDLSKLTDNERDVLWEQAKKL